jgi:hypothetical protein
MHRIKNSDSNVFYQAQYVISENNGLQIHFNRNHLRNSHPFDFKLKYMLHLRLASHILEYPSDPWSWG